MKMSRDSRDDGQPGPKTNDSDISAHGVRCPASHIPGNRCDKYKYVEDIIIKII